MRAIVNEAVAITSQFPPEQTTIPTLKLIKASDGSEFKTYVKTPILLIAPGSFTSEITVQAPFVGNLKWDISDELYAVEELVVGFAEGGSGGSQTVIVKEVDEKINVIHAADNVEEVVLT